MNIGEGTLSAGQGQGNSGRDLLEVGKDLVITLVQILSV